MSDQTITLQQLFDAFIDEATAQNLSKRTIKYYEYCFKWLKKSIPESTLLSDIDKKDINRHIRFLLQTNKATSVNTHLTGLRAIFNYGNRYYGTEIKIKLIKADRQPKPTYTDHELDLLLKKPNTDICSFTEYRNWVMTNVFIGTGCRLGSCINLRVRDVDFESDTIYFMKMKTRKALVLPLNMELKTILVEYIDHFNYEPDEYLFQTQRHAGDKLTDTGFSSLYRSYARDRGVKKAGIHKFRHTYAKQFIMRGGNPAKLQRILGHADISTTMIYVNLFSVDLKNDVNTYCYLDSNHQNMYSET